MIGQRDWRDAESPSREILSLKSCLHVLPSAQQRARCTCDLIKGMNAPGALPEKLFAGRDIMFYPTPWTGGPEKGQPDDGGSRLPTPHSSPLQGESLALFLRSPKPASLCPPWCISPGSSPEDVSRGLDSEARTVTSVPLRQGPAHLHVFRPVTAAASFLTAILLVIRFAVSSLPALRIRPTPYEPEFMVADLEPSHSFLLIPQQGRCQQEASGLAALQQPQSHSQEGKPHFHTSQPVPLQKHHKDHLVQCPHIWPESGPKVNPMFIP